MKNCLLFVAFTVGINFLGGCAVEHRHARHTPLPPAPPSRPPVVVVTPPPTFPEVVVVRPPPSPPAQVIVVNPRPAARGPVQVARGPQHQQGAKALITTQEKQVIREYVVVHSEHGRPGKKEHKRQSLPPGLAKKVARGNALPPGWQKKLVHGETMPPVIYRECQPLPDEVIVRLPPPPSGTILVSIDGRVVRLMQATMEILDVFNVHL
jgi:hypothetical protein